MKIVHHYVVVFIIFKVHVFSLKENDVNKHIFWLEIFIICLLYKLN